MWEKSLEELDLLVAAQVAAEMDQDDVQGQQAEQAQDAGADQIVQPMVNAINAANEALALQLLQRAEVRNFIIADAPVNNYALYCAAQHGNKMLNFIKALLAISEVRDNAAVSGNYVIQKLAEKGCFEAVKLLINIPCVRANITVNECRVLEYVVAAGDLQLFRNMQHMSEFANDAHGMFHVTNRAYLDKNNFMFEQIYINILKRNFANIAKGEDLECFQEYAESVASKRVLLAQVYKDNIASAIKKSTNPLYNLPNEICEKIASFAHADTDTQPNNALPQILYMFTTNRHDTFLLKQAVTAVKTMRNRHNSQS